MMEISTSTYYTDSKLTREEKEEADADIRGKVEQLRVTFPRAGYRPLLHHLKRNGIKVGETRLRRILGESGLFLKPKRKFMRTTMSDHDELVHPNLIHEMTIDGVNQVWAGDITYIRINNGFVFLAVLLDLYSRKVIGWSVSKRIDGQLTLDALQMAIKRRRPPAGVIHHTDRGVQYLCDKYVTELKENNFHLSCSRKGNPYDNAWSESFMKTLKYEEVFMREYNTILDVIDKLPHFIEEVYNKKRLHSSLNYLPPEEFEDIYMEQEDRPVFKL
jgi:transposase InsO family protein